MTIKADNSPARYEYVLIVLFMLSITVFSLQAIISSLLISLAVIPFLYYKHVDITLSQSSLRIFFKIGFFTYRKFGQDFNKIVVNSNTIRFYHNDEIVLSLDAGPAPEEHEAGTLSLWSARRNIELGNEKNCLQIFNEIKGFYLDHSKKDT